MSEKKKERCRGINFCGNCGRKLGLKLIDGWVCDYICPNLCKSHACDAKRVYFNGFIKSEICDCKGILKWNNKCKYGLYVNHNYCVGCGKHLLSGDHGNLLLVWKKSDVFQNMPSELHKHIEGFLPTFPKKN